MRSKQMRLLRIGQHRRASSFVFVLAVVPKACVESAALTPSEASERSHTISSFITLGARKPSRSESAVSAIREKAGIDLAAGTHDIDCDAGGR